MERKLARLTSEGVGHSNLSEFHHFALDRATCMAEVANAKTIISPIVPKMPILHAVLDDIRSLHNVGSIFRSADAFGFEHLHLCGITGTPDRREVRKTSLTAESNVGWRYCINGLEAIAYVRQSHPYVIALERCEDSVDIGKIDWQSVIHSSLAVLVVGNEVSGISEELLATADLKCHIPMRGIKESLNVSVAFGVAAYSIASALQSGKIQTFTD
jgi:tRNA G18 (ribose-2'-O)-methylase SpoU